MDLGELLLTNLLYSLRETGFIRLPVVNLRPYGHNIKYMICLVCGKLEDDALSSFPDKKTGNPVKVRKLSVFQKSKGRASAGLVTINVPVDAQFKFKVNDEVAIECEAKAYDDFLSVRAL